MEAQQLMAVAEKLRQFESELRIAYKSAVNEHDQYLEILLHGMIENTEKMQRRLGRIIDACIIQQNCADEGDEK